MKLPAAVLISVLLAAAAAAAPLSVGGVDLVQNHGEFQLHGAGLLRKGFFFKIYVGALYLEQSDHAARVMDTVPKRIDVHYFHTTPKRFMIREAEQTLRKNLSEEDFEVIRRDLDRLHEAFLDGKKGSFASISFYPGEGLTYSFDNKPILTISCDTFANAYFNIWLGDRPSSRRMKAAMLRNE